MSVRRNISKWKIRVLNKYENTVCDLNKNKKPRLEEVEKHIVNEEYTEIRVSDTNLGDKEVEGVDEMAKCFVKGLVLGKDDVAEDNREVNCDNICDCKSHVDSPEKMSCSNGETQGLSNVSDNVKISYTKMITSNNIEIDKTLCYVPTAIDENGFDVEIFDEKLVNTCSAKWSLTVTLSLHTIQIQKQRNKRKKKMVRFSRERKLERENERKSVPGSGLLGLSPDTRDQLAYI
nr:hypothetical protein [Tanacetum cinerariifolium]